jgi:transposase InsO family protein
MCVDFRKLNKSVITDPFPLPRIQQILEELGGATYFTALDLLHGFYNLKINPKDRPKTAFSTNDGHFEFIRLPMGLKNSPSIFQRLMNLVLAGCLGKYAFIYIDDIIIYSKSANSHLKALDDIFNRLQENGLKVKFSKCQLFVTQISYLGYIVSKEGLRVNPIKIEATANFPVPKDVKGIQAFLGLTGYFRTFIANYATIAKPLYELLKKESDFDWKEEQQKAFNALKKALMSAPVLSFPDFSKPFILTTDASAIALGAILTQKNDKKGENLISCASRCLRGAELRYSNTDREILAVVFGVINHKSYLYGNKFVVKTDHAAIPHLNRNMGDNPRAIRWYLLLSEYDFEVEYKKGSNIKHADALSRYPPTSSIDLNAEPTNNLIAYISPGFSYPDYTPLIQMDEWKDDSRSPGSEWMNENGVWVRMMDTIKQIWVPEKFRNKVMKLYHEPPALGHAGVDRMLKNMKQNVYWNSIEKDVRKYVSSCEVCQKYKSYRHHTTTHTIPIPVNCFDIVSLDIVGPVPTARSGARYILVIQDCLSRFIVFSAMSDMTAVTVARTFLTDWICLFGVPTKIITDRGTNFLSRTFQELSEFLGIQPSKTTAYRPQGNSLNERSHRELHQFIGMYLTPATRETWDSLLKLAAWEHNSAVHESLQVSPFEIITGQKPRGPQAWLPEEISELTGKHTRQYFGVDKQHIEQLRENAKLAISKAQAKHLERLNLHSKPMTFQKGDLVLIRQHSLNTYEKRKWGPKYKGPYLVKKIIGPVVLLLQDVQTKKEDLVHTSYIRPYNTRSKSPLLELQSDNEDYQDEDEPVTKEPSFLELEHPLQTNSDVQDIEDPVYEEYIPDNVSDISVEIPEPVKSKTPSKIMQSLRNVFSNSPDPLELEIRQFGRQFGREYEALERSAQPEREADPGSPLPDSPPSSPTPVKSPPQEKRRRGAVKPPGFYKETRSYTRRFGNDQ